MTLSQDSNNPVGSQFTSVEVYDSRRDQLIDGREYRSRSFRVYSPDNGPEIPDSRSAVIETGVNYGDPHPENAQLRAIDVSVRVNPTVGRRMFEVTWTYRAVSLSIVGSEPPKNPDAPDYQEFNITTDPTLVDVYRAPPFFEFPPNGNITNPPWPSDIGGVPVDSAGQRGSYLFRRGIIEVSRNLELQQFNVFALLEAGGARNASDWQGFEAGRLLYLGARSSRVSVDVVQVVHQLGFDEFFHLQQVADTDEDGNVKLSTPDETNVGGSVYPSAHAFPVRWFQPFPRLIDFDLLDIIAP